MVRPFFLPAWRGLRRSAGVAGPVAVLVCLWGCAHDAPPSFVQPVLDAPPVRSVDEVLRMGTTTEGQAVTVRGIYAGRQGRCTGRVPVMRSDWMLESESACLYVSGPVPHADRAPIRVGEPVLVSGVVRLRPPAEPYLELPRP